MGQLMRFIQVGVRARARVRVRARAFGLADALHPGGG